MEIRSGFVSIIGRPNVGKSTLMNRIIGQKIAITSNKPQTTRTKIQTVFTDERGQIIFVDTPGIHKAFNKLGEYMVDIATKSIEDVDIVIWIVEPDKSIGKTENEIAAKLQKINARKILVINKIDTVNKDELIKLIDMYKDVCPYDEIIPISAIKGNGISDLMDNIFKLLPIGPMYYEEDTLTDQPMRQIVSEYIREKILKNLRDEIPHGVAVLIDSMKKRDNKDLYDIDATIVCEKDSHKGMIIGKKGDMLKKIGMDSRKEIEKLLSAKVNLKLWIKVKKNWRESDKLISNFGFKKDM